MGVIIKSQNHWNLRINSVKGNYAISPKPLETWSYFLTSHTLVWAISQPWAHPHGECNICHCFCHLANVGNFLAWKGPIDLRFSGKSFFYSGLPTLLKLADVNLGCRASKVVLVVKNRPVNARDIRDAGSILGSGRCPVGGHGNPFQCSCLESPTGQGSLVGSTEGHRVQHNGRDLACTHSGMWLMTVYTPGKHTGFLFVSSKLIF